MATVKILISLLCVPFSWLMFCISNINLALLNNDKHYKSSVRNVQLLCMLPYERFLLSNTHWSNQQQQQQQQHRK